MFGRFVLGASVAEGPDRATLAQRMNGEDEDGRTGEEARSAGGIIIPDTAKEKPMQGEVVAVGAGARDEKGNQVAPEVKAGDLILFGKWSGNEVKIDGEDLLIMKESDIMAVIEPAKASKAKKKRKAA